MNEHSHPGPPVSEATFLKCDTLGVISTVCKLADDGDALVVREGHEAQRTGCDTGISLPAGSVSCRACFGDCKIESRRVIPGDVCEICEINLLEMP